MQTIQVHFTAEVSLERAKALAADGTRDLPTAALDLVRETLEAAGLDADPSTKTKTKKG